MPSGRPIVCVATSTAEAGRQRPGGATAAPATASARSPARRPTRSASMVNGSAITMPHRTTSPPTPTPVSPTPKSLAANVDGLGEQRVDERGRHRDRGEQAEHRELARVQRSGGAHHGVCRRGAAPWAARPRGSDRQRTGRAKSHPNHGSAATGRSWSSRSADPVVARHQGPLAVVLAERTLGLHPTVQHRRRARARRSSCVGDRSARSAWVSGHERTSRLGGLTRRDSNRGRRAGHGVARASAAASIPRARRQIVVASLGAARTGTIDVPGAKNSVLKLMAATLLADGEYVLSNVPDIVDVDDHERPARGDRGRRRIGRRDRVCSIVINDGDLVAGRPVRTGRAHPGLDQRARSVAQTVRSSSPVDARRRRLRRPADRHAPRAVSRRWAPSSRSRTATSTRAPIACTAPTSPSSSRASAPPRTSSRRPCSPTGTTTIDNAAREPEIVDLCEMLVSMGADITGVGTSPARRARGRARVAAAADHRTVPDRIQAATYLAAVAVAGGELTSATPAPSTWRTCSPASSTWGSSFVGGTDRSHVARAAAGCGRSTCRRCRTRASPPTTSRSIITMLTVADGVGIVTENLYPGRFRYVEELHRLGADIRTDGHHAVVRGRAAAVRRAGARPRHPRRRGDGGRRAGRRR